MSDSSEAITSDALAARMELNPVVLRRTFAGLRDAGIVRSEKGHGGGWSLARDLRHVSLADVFAALGTTTVFGIGLRDEQTRCPIERAVNRAIADALAEAEAVLVQRLGKIAVADLLAGAKKGAKVHA